MALTGSLLLALFVFLFGDVNQYGPWLEGPPVVDPDVADIVLLIDAMRIVLAAVALWIKWNAKFLRFLAFALLVWGIYDLASLVVIYNESI
jgi:hypothetical protein